MAPDAAWGYTINSQHLFIHQNRPIVRIDTKTWLPDIVLVRRRFTQYGLPKDQPVGKNCLVAHYE